MPYVTTEVEVEVSLSDVETDDLIEELESRGKLPTNSVPSPYDSKELVEAIWMKRRIGNHNYQSELDQLIYNVTGRII